MAKKKVAKREDISSIRPKRVKRFNVKEFIRLSKELKKAIKKEEEKYGPLLDTSQITL